MVILPLSFSLAFPGARLLRSSSLIHGLCTLDGCGAGPEAREERRVAGQIRRLETVTNVGVRATHRLRHAVGGEDGPCGAGGDLRCEAAEVQEREIDALAPHGLM